MSKYKLELLHFDINVFDINYPTPLILEENGGNINKPMLKIGNLNFDNKIFCGMEQNANFLKVCFVS